MAKRKNNRESNNTYFTEKQKEKELDKLRRELIKPKNNGNKKFVKRQK